MIDRRRFVASLGATSVLPALSPALGKDAAFAVPALAGARSRVDLNGEWERFIDGELYDVISVPSSQHPLGCYQLRREFLLPRLSAEQRVILHFDAITYHGRAFVNGAELGTLGPYVPYEFECTRQVKEGSNRVEVGIADLVPEPGGAGRDEIALGVSPGWEAYGGIIRDVYVDIRPNAFIENVRFGYRLAEGYRNAECQARVYVSSLGRGKGRVEVSLWRGQTEVAAGQKEVEVGIGASEVEVGLEVTAPALWSPEEPNLYELKAKLKTGAGEDVWACRTGFREVVTRGREFVLNGERLVLKGLGRHDMWKEQGFTLTPAQMEQDMRMIKGLGANFVRLVHYPHHRRIVELADQLGLWVTEEPGYWGMDFRTMSPEMVALGYRIMERTIRRDWNSPSVFAWLLGNESRFTVEYLRRGKEICNQLDPIRRLVSAANSYPKEEAKPIFEQAGMDFFDQHPYTYKLEEFDAEAQYCGPDKPLAFTEWGGRAIGQSQVVMHNTVDRLLDLVESKLLAGHAFWSWQDMRQYSRIDWEMQDGILESGAVTEGREPRPSVYMELARLFTGRRHEGEPTEARPRVLPLRHCPCSQKGALQVLDLQPLVSGAEGQKAWAAFEARMAKYWEQSAMAQDQWKLTGGKFQLWQGSEIKVAGIPFRCPAVNGYVRPLVIAPEVPEIVIPVDLACVRLHILGQVTFPDGYPTAGRRGEAIAVYSLRYADGRTRDVPVRNGIEVARANLIHAATRIDPVATAAERALEFVKDIPREQYQVLLWPLSTEPKKLVSLQCKLATREAAIALFAITAESA